MSGFATLPSSASVRVIQVGAGGMGRNWLALLAADPLVELVGLVDLDTDAAGCAIADAGLTGIPTASSVTALARRVDADAVVNVTVPQAHHPVNTEALFLGLPVLCEKPIAPSVAQALSLAAASEASGRLLMTSQSRRYYRTLAQFKTAVQSLGRLGIVTTDFFLAPRFGGFRDEMDYPLLLDMAIHPFDVARYLLGTEPVAVYCESHNPSWSWYRGDAATTAIFEFEGDVRYTFVGSWCSDGADTSWNGSWRVNGEHGTALWDGENAPTGGDRAADTTPDDDGRETIAGALAEFVHALRTGTVPSGEVHSNLHSLAMVEAAIRSAKTRERVLMTTVFADARAEALSAETRPDVRAALADVASDVPV